MGTGGQGGTGEDVQRSLAESAAKMSSSITAFSLSRPWNPPSCVNPGANTRCLRQKYDRHSPRLQTKLQTNGGERGDARGRTGLVVEPADTGVAGESWVFQDVSSARGPCALSCNSLAQMRQSL